MLFEAADEIDFLYWPASSDNIYYSCYGSYSYYENYYGYSWPLHAVDVNTGNSWKVATIKTSPGAQIYKKDDKIYYFDDTEYNYLNIKLYSVNVSGSVPVLVRDSLESPIFSEKYIASFKSYFLADTNYTKAVLYDLDTGIETIIESDITEVPLSISPDGSTLLMISRDLNNNNKYLLYDTQTKQRNILSASPNLNLYGFFWVNNEVYALKGLSNYFEIINVVTGNKLTYPESLDYNKQYIISPSGSILAYITVEYPELASGLVGNHYYLNILKAGESKKRIIDLERDDYIQGTMVFSPDETRIAYLRNSDEIYLLNL